MKRLNFLASIAAIFLAPFKTGPTKDAGRGGKTFSIPRPKGYPDDEKEHDIMVQYDHGKVQYFIDGKQVS